MSKAERTWLCVITGIVTGLLASRVFFPSTPVRVWNYYSDGELKAFVVEGDFCRELRNMKGSKVGACLSAGAK